MRDDMLDALIAAAEAAADLAGAVIRPYFRQGVAVDSKADESPVTAADREAERAMRRMLRGRFSGAWGVGGGVRAGQPGRAVLLGAGPGGRDAGVRHGAAAVRDAGGAAGGWGTGAGGDRPAGDGGALGRGGGAAHRVPGRGGAGGVRACEVLGDAELSCTSPDMFEEAEAAGFARLRGAVRRVTWGGDCYAYGLVALGGIDVIAEAQLQVWDWAAVVPVIEGAGGRVTDWTGAALRLGAGGRVLAVGDAALLGPAVALLGGG